MTSSKITILKKIPTHIEIETNRLLILSYKKDVLEESKKLYGDETLTKHFDHGSAKSEAEVEMLAREMGLLRFERGEVLGLFSIYSKEDQSFIGHIDLMPSERSDILEVGYILHSKFQGLGFASEALRAFLFDFVPYLVENQYIDFVERVMATVHPDNQPSKRLLEKVGMKFEKMENRFNQPRLWYYLDAPAFLNE